MTKRIVAFLMCAIMLLAGTPLSPLGEYVDFAVSAFAAETGLRLSLAPATVFVGRTKALVPIATYNGELITSGVSYSYESLDTTVATVSSDGIVAGVTAGSVYIMITANYNGLSTTVYVTVSVEDYKPVTSLTPTVTETINLTALETARLEVKVYPVDATVKELSWTSLNSDMVSILSSGVNESTGTAYADIQLDRSASGIYTVSYATTDGTNKSGSFTINVSPLISSLSVPEYIVLTPTSTNYRIVPVINPLNAGNQVINFSTVPANNAVCAVSMLGYITVKGTGSCRIQSATTDGSNITKSTTVIVSDGTTSITLDRTSHSMKVGDPDVKLNASCSTPTFTYQNAVNWTSNNTNVVIVDAKGNVTAVGPGNATVTATALDGSGKQASCTFSVTQPVKGISLPSEAVCQLGQNITLTPVFDPVNATNQTVTWSTNNSAVAEVSSAGVVRGKSIGTAVITATVVDEGVTFTAACTVSVETIPTSVSLNASALTLKVGDPSSSSRTLTATVLPSNATNKTVTWSSSNTAVATVDSSGKITAVAGGSTVITCTTLRGGKTASCTVTVLEDETSVQILNLPASNLYVEQHHQLTAAVYPSTATNKNVYWSSDNTGVISIDSNGVMTARAKGSAKITATTANKGIKATCTIFVDEKIAVQAVDLNRYSATVRNGEALYLTATVRPSNASIRTIRWASSNTNIATVDNNGAVIAKSAGSVLITATVDGVTASCSVTVTEPVKSVNISKSDITVGVGLSESLSAVITPSNATNKKVRWSSSNTAVATVDANGKVTGVREGTATISVITEDGGYKDDCTVKVVIPVTGVKLNASSVIVPKGETRSVTKTIIPSNATNQEVTWSSSNNAIATVSAMGLIKGIRTGDATVTVTTKDGKYQAHIEVSVIQPVTGLSLSYSSISLDAGRKKTLTATVRPLTATDKTVQWKSSNEKVATVSKDGEVKAIAAGTATITCTSTDGFCSTTCKVTVTQPPTGIKFSSKSVDVSIGTPKTLKVTVTPDNAANKNVVWKSADEKIAKVDENGTVTGIKKGKVKITASTANGAYAAEITVNVLKPVKSVVLNKTSVTIAVGKTTTITATVKPKSASNKEVVWKSSDNDVLTVNQKGKITAKSAGYAVVTCTSVDGEKTAECTVFVNQPVKKLNLNKKNITLDVDQKFTLKASLKPVTASNKGVKWSSSNNKVIRVTAKGILKPRKPGTAIITVTTLDGGLKATCKVTVVRKVKSVSLPSTLTVFMGEKGQLTPELNPVNPTNGKYTWKNSKKKIATINKKGVIKPKKLGTTVITVKTDDGGFTAKCKVTVKKAIKSLSLKKKSILLTTGQTFTLKVNKKPKNATESITWTTGDKNIATVNKKGVVTAVGRGSTTITGTTEKGLKVYCIVTVDQPVTGMKISRKTAEIYMGENLVLTAGVLPENANNQTFTWQSSDTSVLTVDSGVVTPVGVGKATITVRSENGKTASCTITVKQHVTSVSLNTSAVKLEKGESYRLSATVLPENAEDKSHSFTSSDKSVAAVDSNGVITALKPGTAKITVTTKDEGKTATCTVTVIQRVESVSLNKTAHTLYAGERFTLSATVLPANATDKTVRWSSSDSSIAEVSSSGTVTAKKSGKVTVTVTTNDGRKTAECNIIVLQRVEGLNLQENLVINKGEEYRLSAVVLPEDASNKNIIWVSQNVDIASVDEYGLVQAVAVGETVITATTVDGSFSKMCEITVMEPVTSVSLDIHEIDKLYRGQSAVLTATVYPDFIIDDYINRDVTWVSSDDTVATVKNGIVTVLDEGEVTITVTTADGGFTDSCEITCYNPAEEITTDQKEYHITVGSSQDIIATVLPEDASEMCKALDFEVVEGGEYFTFEDGRVTADAVGQGKIRITNRDNTALMYEVDIYCEVAVEGINLAETEKKLYVGEDFTLGYEITPEDAYNKSVEWTTSDDSVVTVDENGKVTAVGRGNATVTVTTADGGFEAECEFTVEQLVEEIVFAENEYYIDFGETVTVEAAVLPENANNRELIWGTNNSFVASVDQNGAITAGNMEGEAVITAIAKDGSGVEATAKVVVTKHAEEIILESEKDILFVGECTALTATVLPENTNENNKAITWTSSDENIATVDENGVVTAVNADDDGESTVTIKAVSFCSSAESEYEITVRQQVTDIVFSDEEITVELGDNFTLAPEILPANAYDKTLTYESEEGSVIEINDDGTFTAVGTGRGVIKASAVCGEAEKSISVNVIVLPESITMEPEKTVMRGKTYQLTPVLSPENVTETDIIFSIDDESIATVDSEGVITALKAGTAVITAQTEKEGVFAKCMLTVEVESEEILLSHSEYTLYEGESFTLGATVLPEDTTNKNISFSSDSEAVTVGEDGKVTAIRKGTAVITVTAEDTGITSTCTVTVKKHVDGISFEEIEKTAYAGRTLQLDATVTPADADNKKVIWSVDDTRNATIDENGLLTVHGGEYVVVTARTEDGGFVAKCFVEIKIGTDAVIPESDVIIIDKNESRQLNFEILPTNVTDKKLIYTSSDDSIVTVDGNGVVTAKNVSGEAVIRATAADNSEAYGECIVKVKEPLYAIYLDKDSVELRKEQTAELQVFYDPTDATVKDVIFTSGDDEVATVSENGIITAVSPGETVVTATSVDGGHKAECRVKVYLEIEEIAATTFVMNNGETAPAPVSVTPANHDEKLLYISSNTDIAEIDENGNITAKAPGVTNITVTGSVSGTSHTFRVTVKQPVASVKFRNSEIISGRFEGSPVLEYDILPVDADNIKDIRFTSSNENIVRIVYIDGVADGTVELIQTGQAEITVTVITEDGQEFSDVCVITVTE